MPWSETVVIVLAVVLLVGWRAWVSASRLDRLHRKVAASRAVVDSQLMRRALAASTLAASGLMDPVSSVLVGEAAWASVGASAPDLRAISRLPAELTGEDRTDRGPRRGTTTSDRGSVESELSATLREALADADEVTALRAEPGGDELLDALADAWYRVQLARRFHNEAVAQAQRVRRGWAVRTFRLAGRAPLPQTLELDDAWPPALGRPGAPAGVRGASVDTPRADGQDD